MPTGAHVDWNSPLILLAAWLITFMVHSTVLLGTVWGVTRFGLVRSPAWKEALWKGALLGGLITATVQIGLGLEPAWGSFHLAASDEPAGAHAPPAAPEPTTFGWTTSPPADSDALIVAVPASQTASRPTFGERVASVWFTLTDFHWLSPGAPRLTAFLAFLGVSLWLGFASIFLFRLGALKARLWWLLRTRRRVDDAEVLRLLEALRERADFRPRVLLSRLRLLPGPIAFGRREICVPDRVLTDLAPEQQKMALAHELAHLVRRDPQWLTWGGVLECVLFFQPLVRVARRELKEIAEYLADDWAVRQTGQSLTLAQCLAEVASWNAGASPSVAPNMADRNSPLVRRIHRLLDDNTQRADSPSRKLRTATALALIVPVMLVVPGVSPWAPRVPETATASLVPVSGGSGSDAHPLTTFSMLSMDGGPGEVMVGNTGATAPSDSPFGIEILPEPTSEPEPRSEPEPGPGSAPPPPRSWFVFETPEVPSARPTTSDDHAEPHHVTVETHTEHGNHTHWFSTPEHESPVVIHVDEVDHRKPVIGVYTQNVPNDLARGLGLNESTGVLIQKVMPSLTAARAGVRALDVVVKVDGEDATHQRLVKAINRKGVGGDLDLLVIRQGEPLEIHVPIGVKLEDRARAPRVERVENLRFEETRVREDEVERLLREHRERSQRLLERSLDRWDRRWTRTPFNWQENLSGLVEGMDRSAFEEVAGPFSSDELQAFGLDDRGFGRSSGEIRRLKALLNDRRRTLEASLREIERELQAIERDQKREEQAAANSLRISEVAWKAVEKELRLTPVERWKLEAAIRETVDELTGQTASVREQVRQSVGLALAETELSLTHDQLRELDESLELVFETSFRLSK